MQTNTRILAPEFQYFKGKSLQEVLTWLAQYREKAKVLAGGTDLVVKMKASQLEPEVIIYIKNVPELAYIHKDNGYMEIGAATVLRDIEKNEWIKTSYSALYEAVRSMAAVSVRNMGTLAGNLGNASPAADTALPLLVYKATLKVASQTRERVIPIEEYFMGPGKTVLEPDELIVGICLPELGPNWGSSFLKMGRVAMDIAKINVAVSLERNENHCQTCRIAFGSVAPTPIRLKELEKLVEGQRMTSALISDTASAAVEVLNPITDNRSTRTYRLRMSQIMLEEAFKAAWLRAGGKL